MQLCRKYCTKWDVHVKPGKYNKEQVTYSWRLCIMQRDGGFVFRCLEKRKGNSYIFIFLLHSQISEPWRVCQILVHSCFLIYPIKDYFMWGHCYWQCFCIFILWWEEKVPLCKKQLLTEEVLLFLKRKNYPLPIYSLVILHESLFCYTFYILAEFWVWQIFASFMYLSNFNSKHTLKWENNLLQTRSSQILSSIM